MPGQPALLTRAAVIHQDLHTAARFRSGPAGVPCMSSGAVLIAGGMDTKARLDPRRAFVRLPTRSAQEPPPCRAL